MKRMKPRSEVRFSVWEGIATHPNFELDPLALKLYLEFIGKAALYGEWPTAGDLSRLKRGKAVRKSMAELISAGAFVFEGDPEDRGTVVRIEHTFGLSRRRLFWLPKPAKKRVRRTVDIATRFTILRRDGFRCVYCGAMPGEAQLHVDHVTPVSRGGQDHPSNLVTACQDCNLGKSDVDLTEPLQ